MTSQPDLHTPFPELFQLDLEPVKLERSWIGRTVLASVDHCRVSLRYDLRVINVHVN